MAGNRESRVHNAREGALKGAIAVGIGYNSPEFKTISAAKTKKKRGKKPRKNVTNPNKNKDFCIEALFLTDG